MKSSNNSYIQRSVFRSMNRTTPLILLVALMMMPLSAFAESIENEVGSLVMEESKFIIERTGQTIVKLYGTVNIVDSENRVILTYTDPQGQSQIHNLMANKDGYYEYYFVHEWDSLRGDYTIQIARDSAVVGTMTYELIEDPTYVSDIEAKQQYLGEKAESSVVESENQFEPEKIPDWVKNVFGWYYMNRISESEVINAIQFLINTNVIVLDS